MHITRNDFFYCFKNIFGWIMQEKKIIPNFHKTTVSVETRRLKEKKKKRLSFFKNCFLANAAILSAIAEKQTYIYTKVPRGERSARSNCTLYTPPFLLSYLALSSFLLYAIYGPRCKATAHVWTDDPGSCNTPGGFPLLPLTIHSNLFFPVTCIRINPIPW